MLREFVKLNRNAAAWLERRFPKLFISPSYHEELQRRIAADIAMLKPSRILEVGGIDRPLLKRSDSYEYVGIDIEVQPTCHEKYDAFIVQSIEQPVNIQTDMVISITLLEHVSNNTAAITSIFNALNSDGTTHHYVPSKWHPYSIGLRMVGPSLQRRLIAVLRPAAVDVTGYPAFFDHCSPAAMSALLRNAGFNDIKITCYFRACDYFAFFLPAYLVVAAFENLCQKLSVDFFCSGFVISARKPASVRPN
jgi:hypothetical protein